MGSVSDPVSMTPGEFEEFVKEAMSKLGASLTAFKVKRQATLEAHDGEYNIDVAAEFEALGVKYTTLIECKHHKNRIKRDVVQVLLTKLQSTGAHKGIVVSTSGFQKGAETFALEHGVALITVTDGRMAYIAKGRTAADLPPGWPRFVGWMTVRYEGEPASALISEHNPDLLADWLGTPHNGE